MLHVKTPEEVLALIEQKFSAVAETESVSLSAAMGRVLAEDIAATEYVPDFDRSTVDGFAVRAKGDLICGNDGNIVEIDALVDCTCSGAVIVPFKENL